MKSPRKAIFITLILLATILQPFLAMGFPGWYSSALGDNEILWVNEYTGTFQNWDERNAPSPYLSDDDFGYIHEVKTRGATEGCFLFSDPNGNGAINRVTLYVECYGEDTNDLIDIWLDCSDDLGWIKAGTITVDQLSYDWETLSFTTRLDSWLDIQNAQIYLTYNHVGGGDDIYVRRAYLYIDYDSEPSPSPEGDGNPDWLNGWEYRKSHTITGSTDGDMYNYSFQFKIYYGDGVDGTETINAIPSGKVYLNETSQGDFEDLRFTTSDGSTLLPMWIDIDSVIVNTSCVMWTKIPYVPESPENTTIYIYWGNDAVENVSDVINTFIFGDDFEDTPIDDPPDANRWDLQGVDPSDWILIKANPDGDGKVVMQHETADGTHTLMVSKADYFTDGTYRVLDRWRSVSYEELYAVMWADDDAVTLWTWLLDWGDYKWYNGVIYVDTGKNLGSNTWYVLGYWMNDLTDGDAYINGVLAASDTYRNDPTVGISKFRPLQTPKNKPFDSFHDYILIMNFTANEPTHIDWGSEEEAPVESIRNIGVEPSDSTVDDEQWFFLNVSIEILADSSTFLFNRIDIDPTGLNMSCSYTNSTNTFVEEHDLNNYLQLDGSTSVKTDLNNTFVRLDYYLKIHSNVTKDGSYHVGVYSTASGDLSDSDTYTSVFTLTIRTPSIPTELFGAGFNASSPYVELHWSHDLLIYDLFDVWNSSDHVDWDYLGQNTTTQYTDTLVSNGTERYYVVRACRDTGVGWKNSSFTGVNFETVYFIPDTGVTPANIPQIDKIEFNTTIAGDRCMVTGAFSDAENLSGYIFWNNATSPPGGVNSSFTALAGTSDYGYENLTLPTSGTRMGVKYYVNDTDNNWAIDTLVIFPSILNETVPCQGYEYNASSIAVITGTLTDGNLSSTYAVDGDWYNVSETNTPPGLDIRFNFTGVGENVTCGCVEIYKTYVGHSQHEIQIQAWNFTSTSWKKVGKALFNETADWVCIGLGHSPQFYVSEGGEIWFRFYHPLSGHLAHELQIDRIDLRVVYGAEEGPPCEEAPALLAMGKYYAMSIILLILGLLIGIGMRRKR